MPIAVGRAAAIEMQTGLLEDFFLKGLSSLIWVFPRSKP